MIVRDQLTTIEPADISNDEALFEKAPHVSNLFYILQDLENLKVTDTRKDNLAGKRREKRSSRPMGPPTSQVAPVWVGPPAPPLTAEETRRVISISDASKSSAGSQLFHATQEQESELLGNLFCQSTLKLLFLDPPLDWATGRVDAIPVLRWRHRSPPFFLGLS